MIPDSTSLEYYLRNSSAENIREISEKIEACFEAGAVGTGCTVQCDWQSDTNCMGLRPNMVISNLFTRHMKAFDRVYLDDARQQPMEASTDMGKSTVPSYLAPIA
ncbi:hypothetical protein QQZ08_009706 [Neonectria magnoliae]|uniref:Uncharacterized protein n=1 Tax=Neonectria magnoliae TaxID=2732573 RepID=A0ABR1HM91_9HYPO